MANTILIKRSGTTSAVPSSLSHGELALNYADGLLYYKNASNQIVSLAGGGGGGGGGSNTSAANQKLDALTFNGSTTTFNLTSSSTAITPNNPSSLIISINGVIQEPVTDYTVSASTITFTTAPASTDVFFGVHVTGVGVTISYGTAAPTGGNDGDIYLQYTP
jgi:hypothetical protein